MVRREASVMNSLYKDSRTRSFHSEWARMVSARRVIQVVAMEAVAPTKEPSAAANAVTIVEFIVHSCSLAREFVLDRLQFRRPCSFPYLDGSKAGMASQCL